MSQQRPEWATGKAVVSRCCFCGDSDVWEIGNAGWRCNSCGKGGPGVLGGFLVVTDAPSSERPNHTEACDEENRMREHIGALPRCVCSERPDPWRPYGVTNNPDDVSDRPGIDRLAKDVAVWLPAEWESTARRKLDELVALARRGDCGGVNCGKCQQCLAVHEFFLKEALENGDSLLSQAGRKLEAAEARVAELETQVERERQARKAAETLNADEVLAKRTNLEAVIESERARVAELEAALRDLLDNIGGHEHWDSTMQYGAGCETCIRQREAKGRARAALSGAGGSW